MTESTNDVPPDVAVARPPRDYSWPALQPTHGAHSPTVITPIAEALVDNLMQLVASEHSAFSYLAVEPVYQPAIRAWAWAEARVLLLERWLDENGGPIDDDGKIRPAALLLEHVSRRAIRERTRLGLDPKSRMSMAVDIGMAGSLQANLERLHQIGSQYLPTFRPQRSDADDDEQDGGDD